MEQLYPPFYRHVTESDLIEDREVVIAAFSGGKDSLTLLHLLKKLQADIPFTLVAAYFNHHLREDAAEEEDFVRSQCGRLDIPLVCGGGDVMGYKEEKKLNLENAASLLRYRFLREVADTHRPSKIATGHSRSDLTETFLIKLLRGSGCQGLGAIFPRKGPDIIRPLLHIGSDEILAFLTRNAIEHYPDPTNLDPGFLRNRLRQGPIEELKKMEPLLENHLLNTATILKDEYEFLVQEARVFLSANLLSGKILPVPSLLKQAPALQRHILREYIKTLKGDLLNIEFSHIEHIRKKCLELQGMSLPGLELKFHPEYLFPAHLTISPYSYTVHRLGTLAIPEIQSRIHFRETDRFSTPKDHFKMIAPRNCLEFPLTVRSPERPDAYLKLNASFKQRVFEMIRVAGIPSELRNLCPLVLDKNGRIVWVAGAPPAHPFRIESKDKGPYIKIGLLRGSA